MSKLTKKYMDRLNFLRGYEYAKAYYSDMFADFSSTDLEILAASFIDSVGLEPMALGWAGYFLDLAEQRRAAA